MVHVRTTDRRSGQQIYDKRLPVADGVLQLDKVPLDLWHIALEDEAGVTSYYDLDAGDTGILAHLRTRVAELEPRSINDPNPPDPLHDPRPRQRAERIAWARAPSAWAALGGIGLVEAWRVLAEDERADPAQVPHRGSALVNSQLSRYAP